MRGTLEVLGEGHYRLRVFADRQDSKVRQVLGHAKQAGRFRNRGYIGPA
jgi:hypothetical protein